MAEKTVDKFKYMPPKAAKEDKKNCGNGKVSIQKAVLAEGALIHRKVIFRNNIGKALYEGNIFKASKIKRVEEKCHKN